MYIDGEGVITVDADVEPWYRQAATRAAATRGRCFLEGIEDHLIANYIRSLEGKKRLERGPANAAALGGLGGVAGRREKIGCPVFVRRDDGCFHRPVSGHQLHGNEPGEDGVAATMHERLGHRGVKSYIQSGNIILSARGLAEGITRKMAEEFAREFGFAAKMVVVDAKRWGRIVEENPYAKFAAKDSDVGSCGDLRG